MNEPINSCCCVLDYAMIGKRIKTARKSAKLTQEELAEKCSCTSTHICNVENGKIGISLEMLLKLSRCLGQSLDYFVMDSPAADPKIKIAGNIAPKLEQCDANMIELVDKFLDELLNYRKSVDNEIRNAIREIL